MSLADEATEDAARRFFEGKRWPSGVECAHCGSHEVSECKDHKPMPYRCRTCRKHFSVRTGTGMADSRLSLKIWLKAIAILTFMNQGISSAQMGRELGITQKSAWFLAKRIHDVWEKDGSGTQPN